MKSTKRKTKFFQKAPRMIRASVDATKRKKVIDDNSDDEIDERLFAEHRNANANAGENLANDLDIDKPETTNGIHDNDDDDDDDDADLDIDDKIVDRPRRRLHRKDSKKAAALSCATTQRNSMNDTNENQAVALVVESARSEADLQAAHADFESVLRLYYRMEILCFLSLA